MAALRSVWVDRDHPRNARYSSTARVGALLHRPALLPMGLSMGRWWLIPGQDVPRRLSSSLPCQRRPASSGAAHPRKRCHDIHDEASFAGESSQHEGAQEEKQLVGTCKRLRHASRVL